MIFGRFRDAVVYNIQLFNSKFQSIVIDFRIDTGFCLHSFQNDFLPKILSTPTPDRNLPSPYIGYRGVVVITSV